jgi:UDP-GlcNAc:undecaprenyl-phosphate GlcNAc-1-phosphate transferase
MQVIHLFAAVLVCLTTAALILVLRPLAVTVGLVDVPSERKSHHGPVPLVGGIAIFIAVAAVYLLPALTGVSIPTHDAVSFLVAGCLLVGVGLIDDFVELSAAVRLIAQTVAALLMIFGAGVALHDLGGMTLSGDVLELGVLSLPFTIFATLGVINAMNMCDGLDGLSGSLALTSLTGFLAASWLWGDPGKAALLTAIGGGIVGFLLFNLRLPGRSRAAIFLGDAGSMFLGFALTWFAISLSQGPGQVVTPSAALWFLMVPIIDAVAMMLRRIVKGRSPFAADREHLHHIFLLAGYSVNQTVVILAMLSLAGVAFGLAATHWDWPDLLVAGAFLGVGLLYFWMIMHAWRVMRFLHRSICRRRVVVDRRSAGDRRQARAADYRGPERRSGVERRQVIRRCADNQAASRLLKLETFPQIRRSQQPSDTLA